MMPTTRTSNPKKMKQCSWTITKQLLRNNYIEKTTPSRQKRWRLSGAPFAIRMSSIRENFSFTSSPTTNQFQVCICPLANIEILIGMEGR